MLLVIAKALILSALSVALWLSVVRYSERLTKQAAPCRVAYVYDGDTIAMACKGRPDVTARLQGLDAAETKSPGCDAELAHGFLATDRLRALVARGEVSIRRVGVDKYSRPLIQLSVDGEDVAETLIREGLAVPYTGGTRIDWCERLRP